jgi:hypothetical protein
MAGTYIFLPGNIDFEFREAEKYLDVVVKLIITFSGAWIASQTHVLLDIRHVCFYDTRVMERISLGSRSIHFGGLSAWPR